VRPLLGCQRTRISHSQAFIHASSSESRDSHTNSVSSVHFNNQSSGRCLFPCIAPRGVQRLSAQFSTASHNLIAFHLAHIESTIVPGDFQQSFPCANAGIARSSALSRSACHIILTEHRSEERIGSSHQLNSANQCSTTEKLVRCGARAVLEWSRSPASCCRWLWPVGEC
jgi:hypothetical protein